MSLVCSQHALSQSRRRAWRYRKSARLRSNTLQGPVASAGTAFKHKPQTFTSTKGETFLFQTGENMRILELPENTRVIYMGCRQDCSSDRDQWRERVRAAFDDPINDKPWRTKLQEAKARNPNAKVVMAFDDVSVPLPPMHSPDIRGIIMEVAEQQAVEEGITDIKFICSVALHRFIRPDEFRHICGSKLYDKYFSTGRMFNANAVDAECNKHIGYTRHNEDVFVCKDFIEADLCLYANCNYVSMDGGYKSYATGMVHYDSLKCNHDCGTLATTRSLYDPASSPLHKSINRIGKSIQQAVPIFHVETVMDDNIFPWYLSWILKLKRDMAPWQLALMYATVLALPLLPLALRKWIFWSPLTWGPYGLLQVHAGETVAVHEQTIAANFRDKVVYVEGQCDILILAPSCIGPYTKDMYHNPLLVNTYALGYYLNMGNMSATPLLRKGGAVIVVNDMPYEWDTPAHDGYRKFFEEVVASHGALDEFERYQQQYVEDQHLNDIYRQGLGPGGVHGFYMYTWAAHGMANVGKVFVVGATDHRGPDALKWEMHESIIEAVQAAKQYLGKPHADVTYMRAPPTGYVYVNANKDNKQ